MGYDAYGSLKVLVPDNDSLETVKGELEEALEDRWEPVIDTSNNDRMIYIDIEGRSWDAEDMIEALKPVLEDHPDCRASLSYSNEYYDRLTDNYFLGKNADHLAGMDLLRQTLFRFRTMTNAYDVRCLVPERERGTWDILARDMIDMMQGVINQHEALLWD